MKKLVAFLIITLFSVSAFAYPITPRPLRKLIIESEYIIRGKVLEVGNQKPGEKNEDFHGTEYAIIKVTLL